MKFSDRFRALVSEIEHFATSKKELFEQDGWGQGKRQFANAINQLLELKEDVGQIPQMRLESKLSEPLLKTHFYLDQARIFLEDKGAEKEAVQIWELEQKVYRLLNEL